MNLKICGGRDGQRGWRSFFFGGYIGLPSGPVWGIIPQTPSSFRGSYSLLNTKTAGTAPPFRRFPAANCIRLHARTRARPNEGFYAGDEACPSVNGILRADITLSFAGFLFREKEPPLNVNKSKIAKYGLSIAQIAAAKRGEAVRLDDGTLLGNGELTYRPYTPRSYAYLSDTNFSARAAELCRGADLMYHEATYAAAERRIARERGHSTTEDAAKAALRAEVRRLVIGHYSSRYKNAEALAGEARRLFPESYAAQEGATFTIEKRP